MAILNRLMKIAGKVSADTMGVPHGEQFVGNPETHGIDTPRGGGFSIMQDLQRDLHKEMKKESDIDINPKVGADEVDKEKDSETGMKFGDKIAKEKRIDILRRILKEGYGKIDGVRVDATTANMLVTVYEALEKKGSDMSKFDRVPLMKLIDFGWKSVKSASDHSGLKSRRAMYWGGPDRIYRLTKEEQERGSAICPKCKCEMNKEPFTKAEKLYTCQECGFKVPSSKTTTTRITIDVEKDGEVEVDVTTAKGGKKKTRRGSMGMILDT